MRKELKNASIRLSEKLSRIDLACSGNSKVNQRSLDRQRQGMQHSFGIYARLLDMSLGSNQAALDRTVIVDYGGGSGTMSMMAKELGIGTVVYADVYDGSCADAGRLGELLGLPIDHTVCGDIDELISYLSSNSICVNAVVSYDVIEHIYDVESHFEKLIAVPGRPIPPKSHRPATARGTRSGPNAGMATVSCADTGRSRGCTSLAACVVSTPAACTTVAVETGF